MRRPPCRLRPAHARAARLALAAALVAGAASLGAQGAPRAGADSTAVRADGADTTSRADTAGRAGRAPPAPYATAALRAFVAAASRGNRLPDSLASYRAAVETEFAVAARREDGTEAVVNLEQVATTLRWTRAGRYEQRVVGYRGQQTGLGLSMLSVVRSGWATPVLYGNRLRLRRDAERGDTAGGRPADTTGTVARGRRALRRLRRAARTDAQDTLPVVHPLAADRDAYYVFTGGDTVATLRLGAAGARTIPIVRVLVAPRPDLPRRAGLFRGELDLDASRQALVRMRGHFLVAPPERGLRARLGRQLLQGYAYVEYVNAEHGGRYWLPAWQRIELQAGSPTLGDQRGIVRIVSRFARLAVNDTTLPAADLAADADSTLPRARRRLTSAPADSVSDFDAWQRPLGAATGALHADDFLDVAPDMWRPTGPPRVEPFVPRVSDAVRFNRVEGLFTGVGARVRFRDALPGTTLRVTGGWAWGEGTLRGRVELERRLGLRRSDAPGGDTARPADAPVRWTLGLRAGRTLDLTNDFRAPFDSGASFAALLGADLYDYVDRRGAAVQVLRAGGGGAGGGDLAGVAAPARGALVRLDVGVFGDRPAARSIERGLFGSVVEQGRNLPRRPPGVRAAFRENRGVDPGDYVHTALTVDVRPDVGAEFVRPGLGARLHWERADGGAFARGLTYQRGEARLVGRRTWGLPVGGTLAGSQLVLVGRGDAGMLWSDAPPPQQLFELGSNQNLPGYGYKEFAGDRAWVARGFALVQSPWLRAPVRLRVLRRPLVFPGLAPGLSIGAQAGEAAASDAAARAAVLRLGTVPDPATGRLVALSRPSDGVRATVNAGVRFFGGAVFVGAARPVDRQTDRRDGWRWLLTLNQGL